MIPHPIRQTVPPLGAGVPSRPPPAIGGPPETAPAAVSPAGDGPSASAGHGAAGGAPPTPPAAEADTPPSPREGAQRAAFDALRLALEEGHVFAALTGPAGAGKTAVLDAALAARSGRRLRIIRIVEADRVTAELAARIERVAQAEAAKPENADAHVVLAVDDAHAASDELLRCLTRLAAAGRTTRLPQLFLAGRPGLWDRLASADYAPLTARLAIRPVLHPAAPEDPWASIERDLGGEPSRPKAGAPPGAEPASPVRVVAAPPAPPFGSAAPVSGDAPDIAAPTAGRRRGALVPLAVLLAVAGTGLYALSRHDWSPRRLADAAWDEAGRQVSIRPARPPEAAAVQPAPPQPPPVPLPETAAVQPVPPPSPPAPGRPPTVSPVPVFAPPAPVADPVPAPAEAGTPVPEPAPAGDLKAPLELKAAVPAVQGAAAPEALLPPAPAASAPTPPPRPEDRLAAAALPAVQPDFLALLLRRGDERLALGDLSAARSFYERAAALGSARGARLVARTYDRAFLDPANAAAMADEQTALAWYRRAAALGDAEAADRLRHSGGPSGTGR